MLEWWWPMWHLVRWAPRTIFTLHIRWGGGLFAIKLVFLEGSISSAQQFRRHAEFQCVEMPLKRCMIPPTSPAEAHDKAFSFWSTWRLRWNFCLHLGVQHVVDTITQCDVVGVHLSWDFSLNKNTMLSPILMLDYHFILISQQSCWRLIERVEATGWKYAEVDFVTHSNIDSTLSLSLSYLEGDMIGSVLCLIFLFQAWNTAGGV